VLLGPLVEEFIFRGLLFQRWSRKWSLTRGIVVSSVVFGLLHFTRDPFGSTIFGMAMCILYHHTRTLWAPFLAHAASNAFGWSAQLAFSQGNEPKGIDMTPVEIRNTLIGSALVLLVALPLVVYLFRKYWPRPA
jgi:membrane protease YdiL (CAAX protease family)